MGTKYTQINCGKKKYETLISIIYSVEVPPSESQIEEGIEEDESEIEKSLDHSSGRIFFK